MKMIWLDMAVNPIKTIANNMLFFKVRSCFYAL